MLELPAFASGRVDAAYDELFGAPKANDYEVNLEKLKKAAGRALPSGANVPTD